ncbi:MAG: glycosyltransferase family 4 protein [Acidobacteriota bacterium]|nr:glycosyltransferase family 4 protein [Acidobacteriota bacterium]
MSRDGNSIPLTVLSVAYPLMTVGPDAGGGAEQILHLVDQGLVHAGMRSLVIAAKGSNVQGQLIATPAATGEITEAIRNEAHKGHALRIATVLAQNKVDLIHYHGLDFFSYWASHSDVPQLATLHLPVDWYPPAIFGNPGFSMNCVSKTQVASVPENHSIPVIANGIRVHSFHFAPVKQDYLLWLGRVCPEKGTDIALSIAHHLNLPLFIAGPVHPFPTHEAYFVEQIKPFLDDSRCYLGPVGLKKKSELLANARCLLVPSLAAETSSLVSMEALSSGTPVIAFRSGALPEIIESGVTGFIVDSEEEMAQAVTRTKEISSKICRSVAENRFTSDRMLSGYLDLYSSLIARAAVRV